MNEESLHAFEWAPIGMLLFESLDGASETPDDWICIKANGMACNLIGRLPLEGLHLSILFPESIATKLADAVNTNPNNEAVDFFVSEVGKWLLASGNRIDRRLTVSLTDISVQKEAAFADRNMLNLYRSLSNSLSDNEIILFDKSMNIVLTEGKPRFMRLNVEEELKGKSLNSLFEGNDFSFLGEYVTTAFSSGRHEIEHEINGKFFKASVYADAQDNEGQENIVGILLLKDVTELNRKQREIELRVQQLDLSNRELEQFAYVASHDLQEPLRKIMSFGQRLARKYSGQLDEEGQIYITRMGEAAKRMERLLDDLLLFSRATRRDQTFEPIDLREILVNVLDDLDIVRYNARISIPDNLPVIEAVPSHMQQLFQNLLNNALKFSKAGQQPVIEIRCHLMTGGALPNYLLVADRAYSVIEIEDQGIGFDQENAERIFTVFQRLHGRSEYSGSGIGLAICKKIVENYGGHISARGVSGKGAVFTVILPCIQKDN